MPDERVSGRVAVERFRSGDVAGCLRVFETNVPGFLAVDERLFFQAFLANLPGPFWIARMRDGESGTIVGCGGVSLTDEGRTAWLRWGLVDASLHRQGIGKRLLNVRMDWIATQPAIERIRVATTAKVSGFFERAGFRLVKAAKDYYGAGLDRHDLVLMREELRR
jgi:RimJ/RimL family protein N-acetyltransferase